jgi:hypothetical protein
MSKSSLSAIDKKKESQKAESITKTSNWKGFGQGIIQAFILTLIWGALGTNFLFLISLNRNLRDKILPDNPNKEPYCYEKKNRFAAPGQSGGAPGTCAKGINNPIAEKQGSFVDKHIINNLTKCGFPYLEPKKPSQTMTFDGKEKDVNIANIWGFVSWTSPEYNPVNAARMQAQWVKLIFINFAYKFQNWISNSIKFSYTSGRGNLNFIFDTLGSICGDGWKEGLLFLIGPLILGLIFYVGHIYGFFSTLLGQVYNKNFKQGIPSDETWSFGSSLHGIWLFFIGLLLFGFSIIMPIGVAITQTVQLFVTLVILPFMISFPDWKKIFSAKRFLLANLFSILVIMSAFKNLDVIIPSVMSIMFIIGHIWKAKNGD